MKRDEISLWKFILRMHQFQLKKRIEKDSLRTIWRKRPVSRCVLLIGSEKYHLPTASRFYSPEEIKEKSCVICCLTHVINGKIIEDEAIYNFGRFLDEDFFLPVKNQELTLIINCCLLAVLRSSALLSPPQAFFCVLCWIQFVLIEIQRVRDGKVF